MEQEKSVKGPSFSFFFNVKKEDAYLERIIFRKIMEKIASTTKNPVCKKRKGKKIRYSVLLNIVQF